jgi:enamine deaminase RidA (YjgF/YER057c/UK114 family)
MILISRQSLFIEKLKKLYRKPGSSLNDVVRVRTFVTNIKRWEEVGRAQGEVFEEIRPAATLVEVTALVRPELMVEIEVDAVIQS